MMNHHQRLDTQSLSRNDFIVKNKTHEDKRNHKCQNMISLLIVKSSLSRHRLWHLRYTLKLPMCPLRVNNHSFFISQAPNSSSINSKINIALKMF